MLNTVRRFIYTKYWGLLYVEHWEDLFTQNTEEYCMLVQYSSVFCVNKSSHSVQHTVYFSVFCVNKSSHCAQYTVSWVNKSSHSVKLRVFMLNTVGRFIYRKYWGILYIEHCEKIC
jgi:hypothetical protein